MSYWIEEPVLPERKAQLAGEILGALPQWFGIPESTADYVEGCKRLPLAALYDGETAVGFCALQQTATEAGELYVLGILPGWHRKGGGRVLITWAQEYARKAGWKLLQVKTLDATAHSPEYDRTREFYHAMGFIDLECFPSLWDEGNPCLIMVKPL